MTHMRYSIFMILILILVNAGYGNTSGTLDQAPSTNKKPYLTRLQEFKTNLIYEGPSPQEWDKEPLPTNTQEVFYQSGDLSLKAWVFIPPNRETKHPALVYFHGGFAFGTSSLMSCKPFMDAGFVVMCPMLRGENGNPGNFELMLGEVEDAKAAVQWLADQSYVNRNQIFAFGHSAGGGISALLSLRSEVPVQHSGSSGGLYNQDVFYGWQDFVPFDLSDSRERELRVLIGNISEMKFPHFAYLGKDDSFSEEIKAARQEMSNGNYKLEILMVNGDHSSSLKPAMEQYLALIIEEKGEEAAGSETPFLLDENGCFIWIISLQYK